MWSYNLNKNNISNADLLNWLKMAKTTKIDWNLSQSGTRGGGVKCIGLVTRMKYFVKLNHIYSIINMFLTKMHEKVYKYQDS